MAVTLTDLQAAQIGDYEAQQILLTEIYRPVYHFIRKRVGEKETADELCQTVFLKVFQRLDSFTEAKASVLTWVFAIARYTLIDYFRQHKPVPGGEFDDINLIDVGAKTDAYAKQREVGEILTELLKSLSEEEATVALNELIAFILSSVGTAPRPTHHITTLLTSFSN